MSKSPIHLWDNSWHVEKKASLPNDIKDSFGRNPLDLNKRGGDSDLIALSSRTIGEWMLSEKDSMLVIPNSFQNGNDDLKDQYIFRVSAKDGMRIDSVTTNNIVGFIGIGKLDIRIHSRFSKRQDDINDFFLYYMFEKAMSVNFFNIPTSVSNKEDVFDFLLFFFPKCLKEALSQGLYKKYVNNKYNDANVRGVIDINRHIHCNIPANGRIAYYTREFSYDNPVTQLIRHTIEFIRRKPYGKAVLHNDPETENCVQQIIKATPTYAARQQQTVINDNLQPVVHPYYTKYAAIQKLCLRILQYKKMSYSQEHNDKKIQGILIDASWLWEEYIARILMRPDGGLKHYTRKGNDFHLFLDNNRRPFQQIIPDYYDWDNRIVADAKYKPLHRFNHLNAESASSVYYKTIMYMYRFDSSKGFLLHPCSDQDVKNNDYISEYNEQNGIVSSDYSIEGRDGHHLFEVGLVIPDIPKETEKTKSNDNDRYLQFKREMNRRETAFIETINRLSTRND